MKNKSGLSYVSVLVSLLLMSVLVEVAFMYSFVLKDNLVKINERSDIYNSAIIYLQEELFSDHYCPGVRIMEKGSRTYQISSEINKSLRKAEVVVFDKGYEVERISKYFYAGKYNNDEGEET